MLTFWVWAPVVLAALIAVVVVGFAARHGRAQRREWRSVDRVAREMARAVALPRRVL